MVIEAWHEEEIPDKLDLDRFVNGAGMSSVSDSGRALVGAPVAVFLGRGGEYSSDIALRKAYASIGGRRLPHQDSVGFNLVYGPHPTERRRVRGNVPKIELGAAFAFQFFKGMTEEGIDLSDVPAFYFSGSEGIVFDHELEEASGILRVDAYGQYCDLSQYFADGADAIGVGRDFRDVESPERRLLDDFFKPRIEHFARESSDDVGAVLIGKPHVYTPGGGGNPKGVIVLPVTYLV